MTSTTIVLTELSCITLLGMVIACVLKVQDNTMRSRCNEVSCCGVHCTREPISSEQFTALELADINSKPNNTPV